jgi:hypothetical protein
MTAVAVATLLVLAPVDAIAIDRSDECRYMTVDDRPGYAPGEVAKLIDCAAHRLGLSATSATNVGWCESRLRPRARNGPYRGVYQIGPVWSSWWRRFPFVRRAFDLRPSVWNARSNVIIALARARGGWSPWTCDP